MEAVGSVGGRPGAGSRRGMVAAGAAAGSNLLLVFTDSGARGDYWPDAAGRLWHAFWRQTDIPLDCSASRHMRCPMPRFTSLDYAPAETRRLLRERLLRHLGREPQGRAP